jgi:hypothetical protein
MAENEKNIMRSPAERSKTDVSEGSAVDLEKAIVGEDIEKQPIELPAALPGTQAGHENVQDPTIVEFDEPNDKDNPKNWTTRRRIVATIALGAMTFVVTFASSIFAVTLGPVSEEYHIGTVTAALGVGLFLLVRTTMPIFQRNSMVTLDQGICDRACMLWYVETTHIGNDYTDTVEQVLPVKSTGARLHCSSATPCSPSSRYK